MGWNHQLEKLKEFELEEFHAVFFSLAIFYWIVIDSRFLAAWMDYTPEN